MTLSLIFLLLCKYICVHVSGPPWGLLLLLLLLLLFTLPIPVTAAGAERQAKVQAPRTLTAKTNLCKTCFGPNNTVCQRSLVRFKLVRRCTMKIGQDFLNA